MVRADLAADRAKLARVQAALTRERKLLAMLKARLARARMLLGRQLVSNYEQAKPNLVSVVLESNGFNDLLDKITYLRDAQQAAADDHSGHQAGEGARGCGRRAPGVARGERPPDHRRDRSARPGAGGNEHAPPLEAERARAGAERPAGRARDENAKGAALQAEISKVEAEQAAAERAAALAAQQQAAANSSAGGSAAGRARRRRSDRRYGPSGGWAIPYAIVLCESGGQNLTPNCAGASGYYQIMPATWKLFGGTGPAAYLASKSEQDAVASRIWNGGAGASNWVCAGIVGIH